ncbi:MAG TPA: CRISPR-associated protein Cas4 [Verrucomicrobia bacterium]|nr:CRISPR-associated protein Cas4 [Verrucomicrobiota bacterium]
MFTEDDLLPISALQHLIFCERQCALIHIEQIWSENRLTAEGRIMHERVHEADSESRGDVRILRGLRLRSLALGLIGVADVVELHRAHGADDGVVISALAGRWTVFPVEYKRGKPKADACDEVQLCAQAMCLEEMLGCTILEGALFYGTTRRRKDVPLDDRLRELTTRTAKRLHALIDAGVTPPAVYDKKCENCSLMSECMPATTNGRKSARRYLQDAVAHSLETEP